MYKLESNRLKREFKITDGNFYASQILNKSSDMSFVPDGNGCEFIVHFTDGSEFSSKGLKVTSESKKDEQLCFSFEETSGVAVTIRYWVHPDKNCICKQLVLDQNGGTPIDYVLLENVGIINSKTNFTVSPQDGSELPAYQTILGQPFYVDSLFFGCEFPATDNRIVHGLGRIKYYIGKYVGKGFECPVTVMGGGSDNTLTEVRKAFFDYIDFISAGCSLHFQYNSWYDCMRNINEENIISSFCEVGNCLEQHGAPKLDAYTVDDGWSNPKAAFWSFNKKFPDGLEKIGRICSDLGGGLGLWLGPRGGYYHPDKIAKRMQKKGNAYYNKESKDVCVGSAGYVEKLADFLVENTLKYNIDYWKLDGFCLKPCKNPDHDHAVGGDNDMYFVTDMWKNWISAFKKLRSAKPDVRINMTCYVNVSPWWLQWVNSLWIQNSADLGFEENIEDQPRVEAEITYRDSRYYDCVCSRALQIPLKSLYNHEPIYGAQAKLSFTDEEFEKYVFWCAVRGAALNELHLSCSMMNDKKWDSLAAAMNFQKQNFDILKNAVLIGGNPAENNVYGFVSWTKEGQGIVALRNPDNSSADLTLTLNKLMGVPESLAGASCVSVVGSSPDSAQRKFSYSDKLDLTLKSFETVILKFTDKED